VELKYGLTAQVGLELGIFLLYFPSAGITDVYLYTWV
jgi:hypothetical protein